MQGVLEKQQKDLSFQPAPGGSDAKDAVGHAATRHQKTINLKAARAEGGSAAGSADPD
jgi:hypothetical protein